MVARIFFCLFICFCHSNGYGQPGDHPNLYQELKTKDSLFFDRAFNRCNFQYLEKNIHKDLVFFHDQGGMQNREVFLQNTRKNICADLSRKPIRKVQEASLAVFPLYDNGILYGVIQTGIHDFYIREANKPDVHTSRARFTHVWLWQQEDWVLREVLSYDHSEGR